MFNPKELKQGQILTVISPFYFVGEFNRVRTLPIGQKMWVTSTSVQHSQGIVKLAKEKQSMASALAFNWADVGGNFN